MEILETLVCLLLTERRNCPSATAANDIDSDIDILIGRSVLVNYWLVSGTFVTQLASAVISIY
jgi:hypothetical protein